MSSSEALVKSQLENDVLNVDGEDTDEQSMSKEKKMDSDLTKWIHNLSDIYWKY